MNRVLYAAILVALLATPARHARAHCQIPCGIYGDEARFEHMGEILDTIEKSMKQIEELSAKPTENMNQIVRWVNNKEEHAEEISEILRSYFLQQRIKVPAEGDEAARVTYLRFLELTHKMLVQAMKCKQTTDGANVTAFRSLLEEFHKAYGGK